MRIYYTHLVLMLAVVLPCISIAVDAMHAPPLTSNLTKQFVAALVDNNIEKINHLLDHEISIYSQDALGYTLMHWAALYGKTSALRLLLDRGATLESVNTLGRTPLHVAVIEGNVEAAVLLLDAGANIKSKDKQKKTAITYVKEGLKSHTASIKNQAQQIRAMIIANKAYYINMGAQPRTLVSNAVKCLLKKNNGDCLRTAEEIAAAIHDDRANGFLNVRTDRTSTNEAHYRAAKQYLKYYLELMPESEAKPKRLGKKVKKPLSKSL